MSDLSTNSRRMLDICVSDPFLVLDAAEKKLYSDNGSPDKNICTLATESTSLFLSKVEVPKV